MANIGKPVRVVQIIPTSEPPPATEANPRIFARIIDADREHVADIPRDTVLARSYVCSLCRVSVHPADKFCRSCGASFVNGGSYGT